MARHLEKSRGKKRVRQERREFAGPDRLHDERSRQEFVRTLRAHLTNRVVPGVRQVFERRVEPAFRRVRGRAPADWHEVRAAMVEDSYYQFWSALQRRSQELMWEAVIDPVERELPALIRRGRAARARRGRRAGSLRLAPALPIPRYHTVVDIHLQPGGYHTDQAPDDVTAGVVYETGLDVYLDGALGPENGAMGEITVQYCHERYADVVPSRILEMGCGSGNSTIAWARAFPRAELHAIDIGAPMLRFAHARSQALGLAVHFSQQNAERTDFPAATLDVVVSHIMLHETSRSALANIMRECHRLLRPGGLMIHLELPRGSSPFEQCMLNWETWNNNETFVRFLADMDLAAEAVRAGFSADRTRLEAYAPRSGRKQKLYSESSFQWKLLAARR